MPIRTKIVKHEVFGDRQFVIGSLTLDQAEDIGFEAIDLQAAVTDPAGPSAREILQDINIELASYLQYPTEFDNDKLRSWKQKIDACFIGPSAADVVKNNKRKWDAWQLKVILYGLNNAVVEPQTPYTVESLRKSLDPGWFEYLASEVQDFSRLRPAKEGEAPAAS